MEPSLAAVWAEIDALKDEEQAVQARRFFKCGPGEYGEEDLFLGIRVPQVRKLAGAYAGLSLEEVSSLLRSPYHEARLLALILLVKRYRRADTATQERIYHLYLDHTAYINNWDLVDTSAEHIVGAWLLDRSPAPLLALSGSDSLWERRIAMMATFHFIKQGRFETSLVLARRLLGDHHDLIHKAVGWMLREIGNRNRAVEEDFLREHYRSMPRTMLRYAIEKFPEALRQAYLKGRL